MTRVEKIIGFVFYHKGRDKDFGPSLKQMVLTTLAVAWPSVVEQFLVSLVGFIDSFMVSGLGPYAIAAVGLSNQPKFITLVPFFSLNVALSSIVARRFGQKRKDDANAVLRFCLVIALILVVIITFLAVFFSDAIIRFAGSQEDTHLAAVTYFKIITLYMVFNVFTLVINAAQRGAGNTRIAMRTNLISNVINLILNYLLIEGHFGFPRLELRGAAIATVIGTVVAFFMSFSSILKKDGLLYLFYKRENKIDKLSIKSIWNVGASSLVEQFFFRFGFLTYAIVVASLGTLAFATHQIGMNIISLSFSLGNGLSIAAVTLVGYSLGEKKEDLAKLYGMICQRLGLISSLTLSLIFFILGEWIFALFSDNPVIINYGKSIMSLIVVIVVVQISQVIFSGCLRGAGDTKYVAFISLISVAIIRPLSGYIFVYPLNMGLIGAWMGLAFDQCMRFLLSFLRFKSGKWVKIKI